MILIRLKQQQAEQHTSNNEERRSSSLRREKRESVKEVSHNGKNGNLPSGKSITNIASPTQKSGRLSNGSSNNMNSVIFPLLSDVRLYLFLYF